MHTEFWQSSRSWGWGGRGHRHGRRFKRGILKYVILKMLAEESRHGYDLIREFRRKDWPGGAGSVYPLLASLEEDGLIAGRDEGERRTYDVTEKGRERLAEHVAHFGGFFEEEESDADPEDAARGDLREAAGRLIQAVRQLGAGSKVETIAQARDLLDKTRREIYTLLARE